KHLLEYAKSKVDELIVFIVEEDKSTFTTEERYSIVKNEYKNDDKVVVILGGPYIISQATFPTYFIKKLDETTDIYT
ncbi:MAG: [citrate (pro-3S)-lyase] ligase, partial [Neofamilia sp.]